MNKCSADMDTGQDFRLYKDERGTRMLVSTAVWQTLDSFFAESHSDFWTVNAYLHNFYIIPGVLMTGSLPLISIISIFSLSFLTVTANIKSRFAIFADSCG